jgi:ABC-2 type transport system ATP-binding protein
MEQHTSDPRTTGGRSPDGDAAPVTVRGLTKEFGDEKAVDSLTFEVPRGTITGFVCAKGAGKTSTLRMLLGLVEGSAGEALIHGRPYRALTDPRHQVGAVVDGPGAHPRHTARTHLQILATAAGVPRDRVSDVLHMVGLADDDGKRAGRFSLGMRQRLALAGALLADPPILLLDEPVNGLDPRGILWMRDLLRQLAEEGRAILISSHLLSELAEIADRVVIIDRGQLRADATLEELADGRSLEEVYFELAGSLGAGPGITEGEVA